MSSPDRGEVWLVDLGYVAKVRPCLVISIPAVEQDRALATLIPHTTSPRGSRFEVEIEVRFLRAGAFDVQNIITIPHAKLLRNLAYKLFFALGLGFEGSERLSSTRTCPTGVDAETPSPQG